jgi:hypothetical protein
VLSLLCTAHLLSEIYPPMKFHIDISKELWSGQILSLIGFPQRREIKIPWLFPDQDHFSLTNNSVNRALNIFFICSPPLPYISQPLSSLNFFISNYFRYKIHVYKYKQLSLATCLVHFQLAWVHLSKMKQDCICEKCYA